MIRLLFCILIVSFLPLNANASIINAATIQQADVITALGTASSGDTVLVPAGTATWGASASTITIPAGVILQGANRTTCIVNISATAGSFSNGVILVGSGSTFSTFTVNSTAGGNTAFLAAGDNFRITLTTWNGGASEQYMIYAGGYYGLIDNCSIQPGASTTETIFSRGPSNAWSVSTSAGTVSSVYIEDCSIGTDGYVCDFNSNGRGVIRFNIIAYAQKVDGHGLSTNTPAFSVRLMEVYNNHWTYPGGFWNAIELRGGTGYVFDNVCDNPDARFNLTEYGATGLYSVFGSSISSLTAANPTVITTSTPHGYATGWMAYVVTPNSTPVINSYQTVTVIDATHFSVPVNVTSAVATGGPFTTTIQTPFVYPIAQQVGQGVIPAVQGSAPYNIWNNLKDGSFWALDWVTIPSEGIDTYRSQTGSGVSTYTMQDIIAADRDYYIDGPGGHIGRGTHAAMLASSPAVTGAKWWVTDRGSWNTTLPDGESGQLWAWNGAIWALDYEPYTYPHPLRGGGSGGSYLGGKLTIGGKTTMN